MLSFSEFLIEALEPLPGKNRGYVNFDEIDGHKVHVKYHRKPGTKGNYVPLVTVNGSVHKEANFSPETNMRIALFVRKTHNEFLNSVHPNKVKITANTPEKAKAYQQSARTPSTSKAGYVGKDTSKGVVLKKQNEEPHRSSGHVSYDKYNPAHEPTTSGKSDKDWFWKNTKKMFKNKGEIKGAKFSLKGSKAAKKS